MYVYGEQGYRLSETCPVAVKAIQVARFASTLTADWAMSPGGAERVDG